jgi:hypothetical protein
MRDRIYTKTCTGNTSAAPVWHVETSHQSQKGIAVVKEMSVNVLGFVLSNLITLGCSGINTEAQWRFPLGAPPSKRSNLCPFR